MVTAFLVVSAPMSGLQVPRRNGCSRSSSPQNDNLFCSCCRLMKEKKYNVLVPLVATLAVLTTLPAETAAFYTAPQRPLRHPCRRTSAALFSSPRQSLKWSQQKFRSIARPLALHSSASSSSSSSTAAALQWLNETAVDLPTTESTDPSYLTSEIITAPPMSVMESVATSTRPRYFQQQQREEERETGLPLTITASNVPTFDDLIESNQVATATATSTSQVSSSLGKLENAQTAEYTRGLWTIFGITLLFASYSPVLHVAFTAADGSAAGMVPPVLFLNAAVSVAALLGVGLGAPILEATTPLPSSYQQGQDPAVEHAAAVKGGLELGLWKFLGTVCNIFGLSMTTASHGAFLIQLTTLIVPVVQGLMGVPIPKQVQASIVLALTGVFIFTQDGSAVAAGADTGLPMVTSTMAMGDALCVLAAVFYATYDLRLFEWGSQVRPRQLVTYKIAAQALFSTALMAAVGWKETATFVQSCASELVTADHAGAVLLLVAVIGWAGAVINGLAPFLQVGGQQAVGPTRAQTIYASQPLWASLLAFGFLGETIGVQGLVGGAAFMVALYLAATAEAPVRDCGKEHCEIK